MTDYALRIKIPPEKSIAFDLKKAINYSLT